MKEEVIAHKSPKSPISEIFRTLRTNIQFINTNKKTKTLLVTSTFPGEGKSWIASNLAVTFAQTGKKVVLIDADMRKGRQYKIFNTLPVPGLSNYLSQIGIGKKEIRSEDIVECIQKTEVANLYLMPAGNIPPNPSELLVSPKMIELLDKFKQAFDIIIIDGTPCELVTDAVILSRVVDSTVFVTAHKVTKKEALARAIKSIQNVGGNLTGVVINKMPIAGKKYEKEYYYYGESTKKSDHKLLEKHSNNKRKKRTKVNVEKKSEKDIIPNSTRRTVNEEIKNEPEKMIANKRAKRESINEKIEKKPTTKKKVKKEIIQEEIQKKPEKVLENKKTKKEHPNKEKERKEKPENEKTGKKPKRATTNKDEKKRAKEINNYSKEKKMSELEKVAQERTNDILVQMNRYLAKNKEEGEEND